MYRYSVVVVGRMGACMYCINRFCVQYCGVGQDGCLYERRGPAAEPAPRQDGDISNAQSSSDIMVIGTTQH